MMPTEDKSMVRGLQSTDFLTSKITLIRISNEHNTLTCKLKDTVFSQDVGT